MKRLFGWVFLLATGVLIGGCSTEFDPNADWKETMVVYGLVDQEDQVSYIRIQKAFLGEGNMLDFAQVPDSNYYPDGALTVRLNEWSYTKNGNQIVPANPTGKIITFERQILTDKPDGTFAHPDQPIYAANTAGQLLNDKMYQLEVVNNMSNNKVTANAFMIPDGTKLISPKRYIVFDENYAGKNPYMKVEWSIGDNAIAFAKIYQPFMRLYYDEAIPGQTEQYTRKSIDIEMDIVRNANTKPTLSINFTQSFFGTAIKSAFEGQSNIDKIMADSSEIFVTASTEDLANYMNASSPSLTLVQERPIYSNIENGVGIFTSRRTHYKVKYPVHPSVISFVKTLNVGF